MAAIPTLADWQGVPARVAALLPHALEAKLAHEKAASLAGFLATSFATWTPDTNAVTVYAHDKLTKEAYEIYEREMVDGDRDGDRNLAAVTADVTPDWDEEILLKRGSVLPAVPAVWNTGNKLLGGPTPLSNGIMAGLLAGGAGYGAGMLVENLFPERYIRRGTLRRTLGLTGAGLGAALAGLNSYSNAKALRTSMFKGLLTNNKTPVTYPYEAKMEKESFYPGMPGSEQTLYSPIVNVPQFNQAAWQDVNRGMISGNFQSYTPPQFAAATTGLLSGLSTANRSPIIRPVDVIRGIASAGVGLATANLAGRALSALAGLTPEGQNKLQDMGLWGGMMHAIVPPLFGR
jgi:hypothetical protein